MKNYISAEIGTVAAVRADVVALRHLFQVYCLLVFSFFCFIVYFCEVKYLLLF